jgi:uncharacterized membrane protein YphA (DoxX/SURF4 family)
MRNLGRHVFGLAAILLGVVGLWSGKLAGVWQPMPDFAEHWTAFPYLIAAAFLVGGVSVQSRRTEAFGGYLLAALFAFFAAMWVKRILLLPLVFGTWGGTAEELAMALGGVLIALRTRWAQPWRETPALEVVRILFGICVIAFGFNHFLALKATSGFVPAWIPPSQGFWAVATGAADVAAGLAIISGILAPLAVRLLTLMFVGFEALIWVPVVAAAPRDPAAWTPTAVNLALIGTVWVLADALSKRPRLSGYPGLSFFRSSAFLSTS